VNAGLVTSNLAPQEQQKNSIFLNNIFSLEKDVSVEQILHLNLKGPIETPLSVFSFFAVNLTILLFFLGNFIMFIVINMLLLFIKIIIEIYLIVVYNLFD